MTELATTMNRLPKVLQNEIWEYVHGGRIYWKQQFKQTILKVIPHINQNLRNKIAAFPNGWIVEERIGDIGIVLDRSGDIGHHPNFGSHVRIYGDELSLVPFRCESMIWGLTREESVKLFYEKVEIEAISGGKVQGPSS